MKYEVVNISRINLVGISVQADNSKEGSKVIGETWEKHLSCIKPTIKNKVNDKCMGLYHNYHNNGYTFTVGCEVSNYDNSELESVIIEAGKYAKFTVIGDPVKDVIKAWQQIWNMDLDRKFSYDFEIYNSVNEKTNQHEINIFVALN